MSTPSEVLSNINIDGLKILYAQDNPIESLKSKKTRALRNAIESYIEEAGVKALLSVLKREQLQNLVDTTGSEIVSTKPVLIKRLTEHIAEEGFSNFVSNLSTSQQKDLAEELDISVKKSELVDAISDEVQYIGMETYFESFDVPILKDLCFVMQLDADHVNSKGPLIEAIFENTAPPKPKKRKEKNLVYSKNKKAIKRGIKYQDIFQHYSVNELQEFARDNGIIASGKKRILINRILAYLDGDKSTRAKGKRG